MILINCDIGERGAHDLTDMELMKHIGMANIACGGHAGDAESVDAFLARAQEGGVRVAAHLSYPDRENFGRSTITISDQDLLGSLDRQIGMMPNVRTVKFHGALYNDANVDGRLAGLLVGWMKSREIEAVVTPFDSEVAKAAALLGLKVISEAFAERRYDYNPAKKQLTLVSRRKSYASIKDCEEAVKHVLKIVKSGKVSAYIEENDGTTTVAEVPIEAETICIHSDSEIALELAIKLSTLL